MYSYINSNLLNKPEHYHYSEFKGLNFINDYINQRLNKIEYLKNDYSQINELKLVKEWIDSNIKIDFKSEDIPFNSLFFFKKIIMSGGDSDKYLINKIIQKFEITKKIYSEYSIDTHKGSGDYKKIELYILFGICLVLIYEKSKNLKYLNSLLKVSDIICSQNFDQIIHLKKLINIDLKNEHFFIQELIYESKIKL